jgi:hypothetical protein
VGTGALITPWVGLDRGRRCIIFVIWKQRSNRELNSLGKESFRREIDSDFLVCLS